MKIVVDITVFIWYTVCGRVRVADSGVGSRKGGEADSRTGLLTEWAEYRCSEKRPTDFSMRRTGGVEDN